MKADDGSKSVVLLHKGIRVPLRFRAGGWYLWKRFRGRDLREALGTGDLAQAKRLAKRMMDAAVEGRFEALNEGKATRPRVCSLSEIVGRFEAAKELKLKAGTAAGYVNALRRLVSVGLGVVNDEQLLDRPASCLSRKLVVDFQRSMLKESGDDLLVVDSRSVSANSTVRGARALFGKRALACGVYEGLVLPDLEGFGAVPFLKVLKRGRYVLPERSVLDALWDGLPELAVERPRSWMCFHLAVLSGMRRGECLAARWGWLRPVPGGGVAVVVPFESGFVPKGQRERVIPVVAAAADRLRGFAVERGWPVGVEDRVVPIGAQGPGPRVFGDGEGGERGFTGLGVWMRSLGWTRRQTGHELRKIFISQVAAEFGAYAAKDVAGHQDLKTTEIYAASPVTGAVSPVFGSLAS